MDLIKGAGGAISRKFFGLSVEDQIKIDNAGVDKLKALAELDNPYGVPSQWVIDLRASFRYIAAALLIVAGIVGISVGAYWYNVSETVEAGEQAKAIIALGAETAGTPFFFVFGERMWIGLKGMLK
jgi:hypothetical protein